MYAIKPITANIKIIAQIHVYSEVILRGWIKNKNNKLDIIEIKSIAVGPAEVNSCTAAMHNRTKKC